jgi:transcriptional regulator with XRE-family HTH domain
MSRPRLGPSADSAAESSSRVQLKAFAGLPQALARLILRDGRSRKEIAAAAELNASMLSGYCSGRRVPSLEHLDKLLTTLGAGIEELTYEMRTIQYKAPSAPLVAWPQFLQTQEGAAAGALLTVLLDDLRQLLLAQAEGPTGERPAIDSKPVPPVPPKPLPAKAQPTKAPRRKRE